MTSYLVIVNPAAGRGRGRTNAESFVEEVSRSHRVEMVETAGRGDAVELAAAGAADFDRVVAVGGDGTLNEVLRGLHSLGRPAEELSELGFVPSGTANAAARAFGLASDPVAIARALPDTASRPVDVGVVHHAAGERPFLLWCGAGYDAVVIDALNATRSGPLGLTGIARSLPGILQAVADYPAPDIELDVDGGSWGPVSSAILANVADVAFGGKVAGGADPFDGVLDVVAVPVESKLHLPRRGVAMLATSLERSSGVRHASATRVQMRSHGVVPVQVDGEPAGALPIEVELEGGAVRLLVT